MIHFFIIRYFASTMRRYCTVIILVLCLGFINASSAQNLDNENFESWIDNTAFIDPEGWVTLNDLSPEYGIPFTVLQSNDAKEGQYAAHMQTYTYLDGNNNADTLPSYLFYGSNIGAGITYPWAKRLKMMSFYYKYKPNGIDSGAFYVSTGYRNKATGKIINNGFGYYRFAKREDSYTKVNIPLYYSSNHKCDTIVLAFINSIESRGNRHKPGTILLLDDIDTEWEEFPPVVNVTVPELEIGVYPNPTSDIIHIKGLEPGKYSVKVIDISGKIIMADNLTDDSMNIQELKKGLYQLVINSEKGDYFGSCYFYKN